MRRDEFQCLMELYLLTSRKLEIEERKTKQMLEMVKSLDDLAKHYEECYHRELKKNLGKKYDNITNNKLDF